MRRVSFGCSQFLPALLRVLPALAVAACGGEVTTTAADGGALTDAAGMDGTVGEDGGDGGDTGASGASDGTAGLDAADGQADVPTCPAATGARPQRRSEQTGAFDAAAGKLVMFGGSFGVPQNCGFPTPTFESEVWRYDPACDAWTQGATKSGPAGRARAAAAYVPSLGKVVVFGGRRREGASGNYTLLKDMWAYDTKGDKWSEVSDGAGMSARFNHSMVAAPALDAVVVFAGNTSASGLTYTATQDVWIYPFADGAWQQLTPTGTPPKKRFFAASVWDQERKRMVIFGGADETLFADTAKYMNDLWVLDFAGATPAWTQLKPTGSELPDARFWAGLEHDPASNRYLLFGGHDDKALGNRNDLWAFDLKAGGWVPLIAGDVWNKPANGFCSFPPDFTVMEDNTPERRNGGLITAGQGALWVAGGKTDCGVVDDLWSFDFAAGTWTQRTPATVGEACVRKGGTSCTDYCF